MAEARRSGSTTHMFKNCGVIHIENDKISEEEAFEIAINSGAKDCSKIQNYHEIVTDKEDFYKIKTIIEKKIDNFSYSAIEWRAFNYLNLDKEQSKKILEVLSTLEELDDVKKYLLMQIWKKVNEGYRHRSRIKRRNSSFE